jgi:hypothetical protein
MEFGKGFKHVDIFEQLEDVHLKERIYSREKTTV